ncbi:MAG: hypothetical protein J1E34_06130 [Oscillospiraceae bacterium]|nr:hypothetical protein [Oscillospiraceae bacterium]
MKRKKIIITAAALAIIIAVSAAIGMAANRQKTSRGKYFRDIVDRVSFTLENTEFELVKDETDDYEITFSFTAKKTEADFYALINSLDIEGINYKNLVFENTSASQNYSPENILLPAENGEAKRISWDIKMTFSNAISENTEFFFVVDYTSGITPDTADEHILRIPMKIIF